MTTFESQDFVPGTGFEFQEFRQKVVGYNSALNGRFLDSLGPVFSLAIV